MLKHRIIPILLWDGNQAVQSVQFKRPLRPVGSMMQHIRTYEKRNIDELIILDVNATLEGRKPKFEEIKQYASELFCPVTYGGGISSIEDVDTLIQECGVDKVAIKSNRNIIPDIVSKYGSQAVIGVCDYKIGEKHKSLIGLYNYIFGLQKLGAGEILLTSIYNNGIKKGYDTYTLKLSGQIKIPLIANGGCNEPQHMIDAIQAGASAVAASTMFLFSDVTPRDCAQALEAAGVPVRVDG